ncbi:MAG: APC family permease [Sorangiineae bacterium]|nr:APC family permease [Sorangiineae bacterium]
MRAREEGGVAERRVLGFGSLLALGINGIVGVGIFFVPAEVARAVPGAAGMWIYAAVALALGPVAITYATLGGHFDADGGPYLWARAAFGPTVAFAVGWIAFVSALFSTAAVIAGLAEHLGSGLGLGSTTAVRGVALASIAALSGTAALGLRPSVAVWNVVTVLKLVPLLFLLGLALWAGAPEGLPRSGALDVVGVDRAALIVVFALQGFEIVPLPAGNARRARRSIPAATLGALFGAAALYVLLHRACVLALPGLAASAAPLVDAARVFGGSGAAWLVAAGTNLSALGIAFGMFAMTPRYLSALGQPDALGVWAGRERRHVPLAALGLTTLGVTVLVMAGRLGELFVVSSVAVLAQYGVSAAALAALALRRERGLRPWQLWPAPLALGAIALILRSARAAELVVAGGALALGALLILGRRAWRRRAR